MNATQSDTLPELLMSYIGLSENGIALLDKNDIFLYHNAAFAGMFGFGETSMIGRHRDEMMTWMFTNHRGAHIELPTLESWLDYVHSRLRSAQFRSFEVDLLDGRWLLLNEQILPSGELILFSADITNQKEIERALRDAQADLERLALTDELTGIPNRRHFLHALNQEVARSRRNSHSLCLAMLDLDHFKSVNDRFGHVAGDVVLKHFGGFLRANLRLGDVVGRLGGEEFAILLPETTLEDALSLIQRISALLHAVQLDEVASGFKYTFSAGIAHLPEQASVDGNWLLASADDAMYQAKATGRNRVLVHLPNQ